MLLMIIALLVFIVTYLCIITEWVNKMLAALIGGFVIIVLGVVDQSIAFSAIDWNVIFFLIGMMLTISVMRETGMFMYIAIKTAKIAKGSPLKIMAMMFVATAVISAILGSVTTIMIFGSNRFADCRRTENNSSTLYYNYGYCCQYGWRNNDDW